MAETVTSISSIRIENNSYDIVDNTALHEEDFNQLSVNATNGVSAEVTNDSINIGLDVSEIGITGKNYIDVSYDSEQDAVVVGLDSDKITETVLEGGDGIEVDYNETDSKITIAVTGGQGISNVGVDLKIDENKRVAVNTNGAVADSAHMSFVVGSETYASGIGALAEGYKTSAIGNHSHAGGYSALASANNAYAFGTFWYDSNHGYYVDQTVAVGEGSYAFGGGVSAIGVKGHAEGCRTIAIGNHSHAEGNSTSAYGNYSHTEGEGTSAEGINTHAEGRRTIAKGYYSHAEGYQTKTYNVDSVYYEAPHAEGFATSAAGRGSHAEGSFTIASASDGQTHAEGYITSALGAHSHAEGIATLASGHDSHTEGNSTTAIGLRAHAEGYATLASGNNAHAEGASTSAIGDNSHAEGVATLASGNNSHAEGANTSAIGPQSHAGGIRSYAGSTESFSHGWLTSAVGARSTVFGSHTKSTGSDNLIIGRANKTTDAAFVIGNGAIDTNVTPHSISGKDIFKVDWDGAVNLYMTATTAGNINGVANFNNKSTQIRFWNESNYSNNRGVIGYSIYNSLSGRTSATVWPSIITTKPAASFYMIGSDSSNAEQSDIGLYVDGYIASKAGVAVGSTAITAIVAGTGTNANTLYLL